MALEKTYQRETSLSIGSKVKDYAALSKLRLSSLVVFSAVMSYLIGFNGKVDAFKILWLVLGGMLVTAASNALNQVIEKDFDKLMKRTENRPIPDGRLSVLQASLFAGISGVTGIFILSYFFNPISGLMGALALISYAFVYTPFKRLSPTSVFIGAVPGSMPLLIGWTAATGEVGVGGLILFSIQFFWQIPHFWSIAWLLNDDYQKAGFFMLPSSEGKNRKTAFQSVPYLIILIAVSSLPYILGMSGLTSLLISLIVGFFFLIQGIQLTIDLEDKSARKMMFASFLYIPVVMLALVLDKI